VYRFETVTYIGKGSGNNGGEGVGKIAGFNFFMKDCLGNPHRQVYSFRVYTTQPPLLATCSTYCNLCQEAKSQGIRQFSNLGEGNNFPPISYPFFAVPEMGKITHFWYGKFWVKVGYLTVMLLMSPRMDSDQLL
jgi:hypothetical protein